MEREKVLVSAEETARQKEYMDMVRALHERRTTKPLAYVHTYGRQQNVADGERLMGMLREMGCEFTDDTKRADIVLMNTCAIRENAEKTVYGMLGQLTHTKAANPDQIICLCGCMAQQPRVAEKGENQLPPRRSRARSPGRVALPRALVPRLHRARPRLSIDDEPGRIAEDIPVYRVGGVSAWVSIMYGCNNFCSYCIVPYVRGRERSREPEQIVREVRELVAAGYKEITLLGQNVNSYGKDLGTGYDFADLLAEIDRIDGDYWVRFMSSQPKDATPKLFDTMAASRHVTHQLHLPVQSGNDRVLRAMNRPYTRAGYLELIRYARRVMPDLVLTSDIIIGFPGETEAEAMDTVSLINEVHFDALFTFIFSPRPGTPAAKLDDPTPREEKQKWFDALCNAQNAISAEKHAAYIGRTVRVLVEGESDDADWPLSARTEGNRLVRMKGDKSLIGTFTTAKISDSNTWALYGAAEETI